MTARTAAILAAYTPTLTRVPTPSRSLSVAELRQRRIDRRLAPYTPAHARVA